MLFDDLTSLDRDWFDLPRQERNNARNYLILPGMNATLARSDF